MINETVLTDIFNALEVDRDETEAKTYGLTLIDGKFEIKMIASNADIYDMIYGLNEDKVVANTNFDFISLITHGWAAPLDENGNATGAPSRHPERRRVRLIVNVDAKDSKNVASILKFSDDDDLVFDHGSATGTLADAVASLFE